jgi:hypothetical protein
VVRAARNIRKHSEVIVERMVLHHHDNDVIDLAEALGRGGRYMIRAGACGESRENREEEAAVPIDAHGEFQCARAPMPWKVREYTAPVRCAAQCACRRPTLRERLGR